MNGLIQCELSDSSTNMFISGNLFIWVLAMLQSYSIEELLTTELSINVPSTIEIKPFIYQKNCFSWVWIKSSSFIRHSENKLILKIEIMIDDYITPI